MHRRVTDIENLQKLRRPEGSTDQTSCHADSAIAHESDIFVVVISVQEAMNIDKIYISTEVNTCAK